MATWTKSLADKHTYLLSKSLSVNETYTLFVTGSLMDMEGEVYLGTDFFIGYLEGNKLTFTLEQASDATFLTFYILSSDAEIKTIKLETGGNPTNYKPATAELLLPLNRDSYMSPAMTYQMNGNILNFDGETVKRVTKDSNGNPIVVSRKGINLIRNGNFANGESGWSKATGSQFKISDGVAIIVATARYGGINQSFTSHTDGHKMYFGCLIKNAQSGNELYLNDGVTQVSGVDGYANTNGYLLKSNIMTISKNALKLSIKLQNNNISGWQEAEVLNFQLIDLTEAYGAGNEPTLAYIQAHPEEFAWTPNPNDLIETVEIKNNLVGDLENLQGNDFEQHEDGVVTYTTEGEEGSVVRVDIDGISDQPLRFRTAEGQQVVITEHDITDADAIKKIEFAGESIQLADKYREVSGTSVVIDPTLHDKTVADKLVIGGTTIQKSDYYAKDGLITQSSNYYAKDGLSSQYVDTKPTGKNMVNKEECLEGYIGLDSTQNTLTIRIEGHSAYITKWLKVSPNTNISISGNNRSRWQLKSSSGVITYYGTGEGPSTITTLSDTSYFRVYFYYSTTIVPLSDINIQLEVGTSATAYEPYKDTVKSGLVMELSGRNFFNDPATTTLQDRSGNGNVGTASGFQYRTTEYADRTADFTGKVSGSVVENPHTFKRIGATKLSAPNTGQGEQAQSQYDSIKVLDGNTWGYPTSASGYISQQLFSFNVIAEFEKAYGAVPSADQTVAGKVAWLKANLNSGNCLLNWYGYGSSPNGNKATIAVYTTGWAGLLTNTSASPTLISKQVYIDTLQPDGFIHFIAYTDASDGVTSSTIYTDYIKLDLKFKPASGSDGAGGIKFDGIGNIISRNSSSILTSNITTSVWFKTTNTGAMSLIRATPYAYNLRIVNGYIEAKLYENQSSQLACSTPNQYNDGNLHCATLRYDGTVLSIYIDGVLKSSYTGTGTGSVYYNGSIAYVGSDSTTLYFNGTIYSAQVYNRALSASEVYQNYMAGTNLNVPSPVDASPVTSNLPAKTYKYTDGSDIYEFTLPEELRGIGTAVDKVVFDKVSKKAFVERRVGKKVFDGTEGFTDTWSYTDTHRFAYTLIGVKGGTNVSPIISNYFKGGLGVDIGVNTIFSHSTNDDTINMCIDRNITDTLSGFKSLLANKHSSGNPVTAYYILKTVTSTPITFTKVTSSSYTEVPMTFLTATPDPLHPADLYSNLPAN